MVGAVGADFQPGVELLHKNHIAAAGAFKQQVLRDFGTMGSLNLPVGIIIIAAVSFPLPSPSKSIRNGRLSRYLQAYSHPCRFTGHISFP